MLRSALPGMRMLQGLFVEPEVEQMLVENWGVRFQCLRVVMDLTEPQVQHAFVTGLFFEALWRGLPIISVFLSGQVLVMALEVVRQG